MIKTFLKFLNIIAHKHTQVLGMSNSSVWCIVHSDMNLHPYSLQIVHSLNGQDKDVCLQFFCQCWGILTEDPDLPNNLLMTDEAHFHLHGTVNMQN